MKIKVIITVYTIGLLLNTSYSKNFVVSVLVDVINRGYEAELSDVTYCPC